MQTRKLSVPLVAVALAICWSVNAQEFAHEIMTGGRVKSPASSSVPVLAYGRDEQAAFPPKSSPRSRSPESGTAAYCVRSCDGRYFPAPSVDKNVSPRAAQTFVQQAKRKCSMAVQLMERILRKAKPIPLSPMHSDIEKSWLKDAPAMGTMWSG